MPMCRWIRHSGRTNPCCAERPVPRDRVLVVRVDERAVDVEDRGGLKRSRRTDAARLALVLALAELLDDLGAERRQVVRVARATRGPRRRRPPRRPRSPPALRRSVCSDGHEVSVRPLHARRPRPASTGRGRSRRPAWPARRSRARSATASSSVRRKSGFATPPGQHERRRSRTASASATVWSTVNVSALSRWLNAWTSPDSSRDQLGRAARLLDRLPRLGQLDLLDALGARRGTRSSCHPACPPCRSSSRFRVSPRGPRREGCARKRPWCSPRTCQTNPTSSSENARRHRRLAARRHRPSTPASRTPRRATTHADPGGDGSEQRTEEERFPPDRERHDARAPARARAADVACAPPDVRARSANRDDVWPDACDASRRARIALHAPEARHPPPHVPRRPRAPRSR